MSHHVLLPWPLEVLKRSQNSFILFTPHGEEGGEYLQLLRQYTVFQPENILSMFLLHFQCNDTCFYFNSSNIFLFMFQFH